MSKLVEANNIDFYIYEDGIYLKLKNPRATEKEIRVEAILLIQENSVKDINFEAVEVFIKSRNENKPIKISSNTNVVINKETIEITFSEDLLKAFITFRKNFLLIKPLTFGEVSDAISKSKIKFGLDNDYLAQLQNSHEYNNKYIIASGIEPINGIDGYVEYFFDKDKKKSLPKIMEDGTVDFHNIDFFESATSGKILTIAHNPIVGKDGTNVLGQPVRHIPGKLPDKIFAGKNTIYDEKTQSITANISGKVMFEDRRISISPVLEINGDVGPATGDIDFPGSVFVRGGVLTNFSIIAGDTIEIKGVVEGARLKANGEIKIYSGVQGIDKAEIYSEDNIYIKYAERSTIYSRGDIYIGSLMHCDLSCDGNLMVNGDKSLIVGGVITVGESIVATKIGSSMGTRTNINVGNAPHILKQFFAYKEERKNIVNKLLIVKQSLIELKNENTNFGVTDKRRASIIKLNSERKRFTLRVQEINDSIKADILPNLNPNRGKITVNKQILPGVNFLIGNAMLVVKDIIDGAELENINGKIIINGKTIINAK